MTTPIPTSTDCRSTRRTFRIRSEAPKAGESGSALGRQLPLTPPAPIAGRRGDCGDVAYVDGGTFDLRDLRAEPVAVEIEMKRPLVRPVDAAEAGREQLVALGDIV